MADIACTTVPSPAHTSERTIDQHRRAYAAWQGLYQRLNRLREDFDPEYRLDDDQAKRDALTAIYGQGAPAVIAAYFATSEAAEAAGRAEDEAWRRVESLPIGSREDLTTWLSYVEAHSRALLADGNMSDSGVTLGTAMRRVGEMLAERLAA